MSVFSAIVLAAGQAKRMQSPLPKVLHPVAGRPMVHYPVEAALQAGAVEVVVVVPPVHRDAIANTLSSRFGPDRTQTVVQEAARGTGHAVQVALGSVTTPRVLILCGDTPLVTAEDLSPLGSALSADEAVDLALLSGRLSDPTGYGRVLRDPAGRVTEVREDRDLKSDEERRVDEVNAGAYLVRTQPLARALAELSPSNAQGEYYLTDIVATIARSGTVRAVLGSPEALIGVNDRRQLREVDGVLGRRIIEQHARCGVTIRGLPHIDHTVEIEADATIEDNVHLRGTTRIGTGATIDVGCVITDSVVEPHANLKPYSVVVSSRIGSGAQIGPFAHLRPASEIEEDAHIGNFVETKKTRVRRGAKANHLAYLGDGDIGAHANIGAGTIFCNYDGFRKHQTIVGEGAFVGSDSQVVAPVTIGQGAYVATGTTVTEDVPADALAIGRARQQNKPGYASKLRERLRSPEKAK